MSDVLGNVRGQGEVKERGIIGRAFDVIKSIPGKYIDTHDKMKTLHPDVAEKGGIVKLGYMVARLFTQPQKVKEYQNELDENLEAQEDLKEITGKFTKVSEASGVQILEKDPLGEAFDKAQKNLVDKQADLEKKIEENTISLKEKAGVVAGSVGMGVLGVAGVAAMPAIIAGSVVVIPSVLAANKLLDLRQKSLRKRAEKSENIQKVKELNDEGKLTVRGFLNKRAVNKMDKQVRQLEVERAEIEHWLKLYELHIEELKAKLIEANKKPDNAFEIKTIEYSVNKLKERYDEKRARLFGNDGVLGIAQEIAQLRADQFDVVVSSQKRKAKAAEQTEPQVSPAEPQVATA